MSSAVDTPFAQEDKAGHASETIGGGSMTMAALLTSLIGQLSAAASIGSMFILPKAPFIPVWLLYFVFGALLISVFVAFGLGKWGATALFTIGFDHPFTSMNLVEGLIAWLFISAGVSLTAYLADALKPADELSAFEYRLRTILGTIIFLETSLAIIAILFFISIAFSLGSFAQVG